MFPTPERKWHPISQILKDKIKNANKDEDFNLNKKYNWKLKKKKITHLNKQIKESFFW